MKIQNRQDIRNIPVNKILFEEHHAVSENGTPIVIRATTWNKMHPKQAIAQDRAIMLGLRLDAENKMTVGFDHGDVNQAIVAIEAIYDLAIDDAKFACAIKNK